MNITASYLTLAGNTFGQPTRYAVPARSHAAHHAGFCGIGALHTEPIPHRGTHLPAPVTELEWFDLATGTGHDLAMITAWLARHPTITRLNVGTGASHDGGDAMMATHLAMIADTVAPYGVTVACEPVAFGSLWSPRRVCHLITMAGRPNVGYLFDTWHQTRARLQGDPTQPPAHLVCEVQLSGYSRCPDAFTGAMNRARTGAPAMAQLAHLVSHGYAGPVDVEMTNAHTRAMTLADMARAAMPAMGRPPAPVATWQRSPSMTTPLAGL